MITYLLILITYLLILITYLKVIGKKLKYDSVISTQYNKINSYWHKASVGREQVWGNKNKISVRCQEFPGDVHVIVQYTSFKLRY